MECCITVVYIWDEPTNTTSLLSTSPKLLLLLWYSTLPLPSWTFSWMWRGECRRNKKRSLTLNYVLGYVYIQHIYNYAIHYSTSSKHCNMWLSSVAYTGGSTFGSSSFRSWFQEDCGCGSSVGSFQPSFLCVSAAYHKDYEHSAPYHKEYEHYLGICCRWMCFHTCGNWFSDHAAGVNEPSIVTHAILQWTHQHHNNHP